MEISAHEDDVLDLLRYDRLEHVRKGRRIAGPPVLRAPDAAKRDQLSRERGNADTAEDEFGRPGHVLLRRDEPLLQSRELIVGHEARARGTGKPAKLPPRAGVHDEGRTAVLLFLR